MAILFKNTETESYPWLKTLDNAFGYLFTNVIENKNPLIQILLGIPTVVIIGILGSLTPLAFALHYIDKGYFTLTEWVGNKIDDVHDLDFFWIIPLGLLMIAFELIYYGPLRIHRSFKERRQRKSSDEVIRVRPLGEPSDQLFYIDVVYEVKHEKSIEPSKKINKHKFK